MDNQRDKLAAARLCRFCLSGDNPLTNIYDKNIQKKDALITKNLNLPMKILMSISVECFPSDKMPMYICNRCIFFMDIVYKFKNICREADNAVTQFLHMGSSLEPIKWTPSLLKVFNTMQKQNPDVEVLKIEGGPTVQVSQDATDTEDEDEDVYNVTIGDGTQGGTSACVKVVTKEEPAKGKKKEHGLLQREFEESSFGVDFAEGANEEEESLPEEIPKSPPKPKEGSWACDECNNSYPLQQLLELHKMQKHRSRNFVCDICEAKFFSRYDLETHMFRHNQDVQFQCVACDKNFKRDVLLRRHERSVHPELLKYKCVSCPASFIEQEDLTAHRDRHHQRQGGERERKYQCAICSKKFYDKYSLTRHQLVVHSMRTWLACEYCPERFNSVSKLTRHVRSHAGEKAYPCKFCNKRFTKSHHCTRHMRLKHADLVHHEEYNCEECSATFSNQEDLIYHSACHATVNCICPLCQEKFPDVDAVTAHIKTHGSGNEFTCDFCELMFTSNEKLESHLMTAHADEMEGSDASHNGEDSMEMGGEEDFDDEIQVKEDGDQMIVEIKKPNSFLKSTDTADDKTNYTNSEESESESAVTEPQPQPQPSEAQPAPVAKQLPIPPELITAVTISPVAIKTQTARDIAIVQKAEEERRKAAETPPERKVDKPKVETDKSLRLLEKELQELQRTNKREETAKTQPKPIEMLRNRRAQIHTSTPKLRSGEEKKTPAQVKTIPADKKTPVEKRGVKENKRPEETKDKKPEDNKAVNNNGKEEKKEEGKEGKNKEEREPKIKEETENKSKEDKDSKKEEKESKKEEKESKKEEKESKNTVTKEDSKEKNAVKNGAAIKTPEDGVRRSSRASKVKDYAKMVQSRPTETTPSDDDSDDSDDENYVEAEKNEPQGRQKKRLSQKVTPKAPAAKATVIATTPPPRKRGRPRKNPVETEIPTKVKKADVSTSEANASQDEKMDVDESTSKDNQPSQMEKDAQKTEEISKSETPTKAISEPKPVSSPVPPTAALKKVPVKSLPPGVKPLPLPTGARPLGPSEISEMQIGKKVVKVQTIVMTKAEVEAMAKKGLVEMKDGTMVLKPGVKLADPTLKSIVAEKTAKEAVKATPTRCELDA